MKTLGHSSIWCLLFGIALAACAGAQVTAVERISVEYRSGQQVVAAVLDPGVMAIGGVARLRGLGLGTGLEPFSPAYAEDFSSGEWEFFRRPSGEPLDPGMVAEWALHGDVGVPLFIEGDTVPVLLTAEIVLDAPELDGQLPPLVAELRLRVLRGPDDLTPSLWVLGDDRGPGPWVLDAVTSLDEEPGVGQAWPNVVLPSAELAVTAQAQPWYFDTSDAHGIGVAAAYREIFNPEPIRIAIVDSGFDADLLGRTSNLVLSWNAADGSDNVAFGSAGAREHGTAMAGLAASSRPPLGVCWHCELAVIASERKPLELIRAFEKAKAEAVRVMVTPWHFSNSRSERIAARPFYSVVEGPSWDETAESSVLILAASGNYRLSEILPPSRHPRFVAIGGIDCQGERYRMGHSGPELELLSPTRQDGDVLCEVHTVLGRQEGGTSAASAIAAGAAALLLSAKPDATAANVRTALAAGARYVVGQNGRTEDLGFGRIWLPDALAILKR